MRLLMHEVICQHEAKGPDPTLKQSPDPINTYFLSELHVQE